MSEVVAWQVGDAGSLFSCITCSAPVAPLMFGRLPPQEPFDVLPPPPQFHATAARAPRGRGVHRHQHPRAHPGRPVPCPPCCGQERRLAQGPCSLPMAIAEVTCRSLLAG